MRNITRKITTTVSLGLILTMLVTLIGPFVQIAQATAISSASNIMSSLRVNTLSNHEIRFISPTGAAVSQTITITFPAGFAMGAFHLLNFDIATAPTCAGPFTERTVAATAGAGTWGVAQAAQVITLTAPTDVVHFAPTNCLRVRIGNNAVTGGTGVNQITNPATPSSYAITIGGTFGNTGTITVPILTDDQVAVSGIVGQTISFSLGTNTLALGTLSVTAAVTGSHTMSLATNAVSGMAVTYSGATLTSGVHTITALSAGGTSVVGTEQFGLNAVANTTPVVGAACSGTAPIAAAATGYATPNNFRFVSGETIVSSAGPINLSTCTISYLANIAGITEAGTYSTTLTYTATATF